MSISAPGLDIVGGKETSVRLQIFERWKLVAVGLIAAAILTVVVLLGWRTSILRDREPGANPDGRCPFSLARCQMAFWFVLILWSFLAIWMVTGDFNDIVTSQSLALLGISGATALGATAVDSLRTARMGQPKAPPKHDTFWSDLLTDDTGWAFHRLQVVVWTIVLGVVSLWSVRQQLALPTFDNNLLILMGISSGLYVGAKWPEQQTNAQVLVPGSAQQGATP